MRIICTRDYEGLSQTVLNWLKNGHSTVDSIIKDLDEFTRGYLREKKRYMQWMDAKPIENPKNNKEVWYNIFWKEEHSERSLYKEGMAKQLKQFNAFEKALMEYLSVYGLDEMNEKEIKRALKKIETRKAKMTC